MHPYESGPPERYWRSGVGNQLWTAIDFKPHVRFKLNDRDRVATAGSCFAQHIARHLPQLGLEHHVVESPSPLLDDARAAALGFGVFSARYGNIYTARQLRQLIEAAFGVRASPALFAPHGSKWVDLLRPSVQGEGFDSPEELVADRGYHLERCAVLFSQASCLVFTLGLTEAWVDQPSGQVLPVCPGVRAGTFDAERYRFINFTSAAVLEDLRWCVEFLRARNPALRWIFTVSPVALAATMTEQHVAVATAGSKAVLRAAVGEIVEAFEHCEYFPSLEITTGAASFGQFLAGDLRTISERGVRHVMAMFGRAFVDPSCQPKAADVRTEPSVAQQLMRAADAECDEAFNDPAMRGSTGPSTRGSAPG